MIEQTARVVRVDGDIAEVTTEQQSTCGNCAAGNGCGTALIARWLPQRHPVFRLPNHLDAKPGDAVVVGLDEGQLQRGSLILYALPLLGLLGGAVGGELLLRELQGSTELGAVVFGLLGLIAALYLVRRLTTNNDGSPLTGVRLLRVVHRPLSSAQGELPLPFTGKLDGHR